MKKVAVNDFVLRQVKGSGKTYSDHLSFDEIVIDAESQMARGFINFVLRLFGRKDNPKYERYK